MRKNIFTKIAAVGHLLLFLAVTALPALVSIHMQQMMSIHMYMLDLHGRNTGLTRAYITQEM